MLTDDCELLMPEGRYTKISAIAGVLGVIVAILLGVAQCGSGSSTSGPTPSNAPTSGSAETGSSGQTDSTEGGATPEQAAIVPAARHSGQITIPRGESIDLDAPSSDPLWARVAGGYEDLLNVGNRLSAQYGSQMIVLGGTSPTFETCRRTGYSNSPIRANETAPDMAFCVYTNDDRFVAGRIKTYTEDQVVIEVTSYDPPIARN